MCTHDLPPERRQPGRPRAARTYLAHAYYDFKLNITNHTSTEVPRVSTTPIFSHLDQKCHLHIDNRPLHSSHERHRNRGFSTTSAKTKLDYTAAQTIANLPIITPIACSSVVHRALTIVMKTCLPLRRGVQILSFENAFCAATFCGANLSTTALQTLL